jgi:signal peptidase I
VVLRNPHDGEQLCVKRIVGLPGEHLTLQQGNLVADGHVLSKPEPLQKKLRCALHTETQQNLRWHAGAAGGWQYTLDHWQHTGGSPDSIDWLTYQHGQPITDDLPYNAGITRRLNLVHALQLAARVQWPGPGTLFFRLDDGQTSAQVAIQLPAGTLTLTVDNRAPAIVQLPSDLLQKLAQQPVWFEFSNFDQRLLLKIEGQQLLQCPWPMTKALGTAQPFAIGVQVAGIEFAGVQGARIQGAAGQGAAIRLLDLRLYRDRYDSQHPVGTPPLPSGGWQLASDQYFLLGDNSPISLDSRLWGPVSGRLLLGKPIFLGR